VSLPVFSNKLVTSTDVIEATSASGLTSKVTCPTVASPFLTEIVTFPSC